MIEVRKIIASIILDILLFAFICAFDPSYEFDIYGILSYIAISLVIFICTELSSKLLKRRVQREDLREILICQYYYCFEKE
jgi:hypothetical protein